MLRNRQDLHALRPILPCRMPVVIRPCLKGAESAYLHRVQLWGVQGWQLVPAPETAFFAAVNLPLLDFTSLTGPRAGFETGAAASGFIASFHAQRQAVLLTVTSRRQPACPPQFSQIHHHPRMPGVQGSPAPVMWGPRTAMHKQCMGSAGCHTWEMQAP